ncbi:baseplate assembly protein [Arthrobacter sp. ERGS1:01]|uniref:phage baseplate assembly protein V n=1 Tax=Arthrobacter sp. ERGS1:01 TaxID=1704044 RepID=UPI0006B403EE|nr:phage baseplate assembly protein V [Arthrobacter sp. ERGS1:01]ALE06452.1 baseplate assembly protein [Arthrobacter sp. ERGS1:01]
MSGDYYGKFRGTVVQNVDPQQMGRIQAIVPSVTNVIPATWAMPCAPFTGKQSGVFVVPAIGSAVWIEYEQGDLDYPIWTGGFWGSAAEVPAIALAGNPISPSIVLQSGLGNSITISDLPGPAGGIIIKSAGGASIMVNETGITITNGAATIVMAGPTVTINNGALAIT